VPAPELTGDALAAVKHRGSHMQIIAAAGSGKTEVVSQRVADLLVDGVPSSGIVAFTFTERAAAELKHRIALRVEERLGPQGLDRLSNLFVGTIHSYCFRLLQAHVPRYETYDVLDENQLTAFVAREATRLEVKQLDPAGRNRLFASIAAFLEGVDVVENELLDPTTMPEPFRTVLLGYLASLERYRLLTFGQQVVRAVAELERPEVAASVHAELRHLIVDEYQDVNPAQERLVQLLAAPGSGVELCVVGDDDQAIYQWRGSDVSGIVTFADRYPDVAMFEITTNRRSRPGIIDAANGFAASIPGRLAKSMSPDRAAVQGDAVTVWWEPTEMAETGWIAMLVDQLHGAGVPFRDIAVLVRGRAAYPRLLEQFASFDIPVQPGGRSALFEQPEARTLGRVMCWLAGWDWRDTYGPPEAIGDDQIVDELVRHFRMALSAKTTVRRALHQWRSLVGREDRSADLVGELYDMLGVLGVASWDLSDPLQANRLGTLARFTMLLADYESVRRRARHDDDVPGEQVGGQDRGHWYYRNLATHIVNYAQGAYEDFDGEPDLDLDAVDVLTVHRAKGLEWPVVFVPSMTKLRFPSSRTGQQRQWLVPRDRFAAARYEGSDADERRLFYVALTRARDWASVSRHSAVTNRQVAPSPYWQELTGGGLFGPVPTAASEVVPPTIEPVGTGADEPLAITYSDLAAFLDCGHAYRLRSLMGFQPRLAPELGYGKAIHHVLRTVAEETKSAGAVPTAADIDGILDHSFFLPTANKVAHRQLKDAARRLVHRYAAEHADDLQRVWETERPFELHLDGVTISGRADVILDHEGGVPTALAIVDYKTSTREWTALHDLQLQVYADAGRREGLDVQAAWVHDLKAASRVGVTVAAEALSSAEQVVQDAAVHIRSRDFEPDPGPKCRKCEVRTVCGSAVR
jgi:DNA helicase-2/ATP-dependent DNA helicase PcrA